MMEKILVELGMGNLPEEEKISTMERIGKILYQAVMLRVMDTMTDEQAETFGKAMGENPTPEFIINYLKGVLPNMNQIIEEEALKFKAESKAIMSLGV